MAPSLGDGPAAVLNIRAARETGCSDGPAGRAELFGARLRGRPVSQHRHLPAIRERAVRDEKLVPHWAGATYLDCPSGT